MKEYKFKATIKDASGGGAYVEFPYDVMKEFGKLRVPVRCTFDGIPYRGTMVKYGAPKHMLLILKSIREKLQKQPGDTIDVWMVEDKEERVVETPEDFKKALKKAKLDPYFTKLSFTHRKEYVKWITEAKKPETRVGRIEKAIEQIRSKQTGK